MKLWCWLYYGFIYRRLMKLAHRFDWHHMPPCYPDGDTMLHCSWCGIRVVTYRRESNIEPITNKAKKEIK